MSASHPRLNTRICDLFKIEYPIVQTGMGWVSTARLTAATSAAEGLVSSQLQLRLSMR